MLKLRHVLFTLNLSVLDIVQLFIFLSPFFLMLLIPIAVMVSMFLTMQRMSADREILALRTGGITLPQILPAPLVFLILLTGLSTLISFDGVSWGMQRFQNTLLDMAKTKTQLTLRPGSFNQDFPGFTIYTQKIDKNTGFVQGIFIEDKILGKSSIQIVAPQGQIMTDYRQGKIFFSLSNGRIYSHNKGGMNILKFSQYKIALDIQKLLGEVDIDKDEPKYMSMDRLRQLLRDPENQKKRSQEFQRQLEVEHHKRVALPVACFVLGFMALPLGWMFEDVQRHVGAVMILAVFFVYYALFSLGMSLGETGKSDPAIGVWFPNILFAFLSLGIYYWTTRKDRGKLFFRIRTFFR
jgi:lipopolysaccharide export system permease protein